MTFHDEDDDADDLRDDEDPDEADTDADDAEDESDWSEPTGRSRPIWMIVGLIAVVALLVWVFLTRRAG